MQRVLLVLLLATGCAANRSKRGEDAPDPTLMAIDRAWENRGAKGLGPVEAALQAALNRPGADVNPDVLWRQARYLVHRGMTEEDDRRVALDTYATARAQAMHCLEQVPVWSQRRKEAGLEAALLVVNERSRPCLAWGALGWSRWIALMGGDAAGLDLEDVAIMGRFLDNYGSEEEAGLGRWAVALVSASRPTWTAEDEDRGQKRLERVAADRPRDLVPHWDMLTFIALPADNQALAERERKEILDGTAFTPADRAVKARVQATE